MPSSTRASHPLSKARIPLSRSVPAHDGSSSGSTDRSWWFLRSGRSPSRICRSSTGAPAAQACGRAAVGYAIGNGVSARGSPANTSGSWYSKWPAAFSMRRIRGPERRRPTGQPGAPLRQLVLEVAGRVQHSPDDPLRLGPARVPGKTPGDERIVMRPDRAVVVRERVEASVVRGHCSNAPARPEVRAHEPVDDRVDLRRRDDPAPEQVPDVRAERVDLLLLAVEREHVEAAAGLVPERLVEARAQLPRLPVEAP